jgi:hypothetical protein
MVTHLYGAQVRASWQGTRVHDVAHIFHARMMVNPSPEFKSLKC